MIETIMELCRVSEKSDGIGPTTGQEQRDEGGEEKNMAAEAESVTGDEGLSFSKVCTDTFRLFDHLPSTPDSAALASTAFAGATGYIDGGPRLNYLLDAMVRNAFDERDDRARRGLGLGPGSPCNRFVDLETGIRMRHIVYSGSGSGANASTVLFLHDLGDSAESFAPLVSELNMYYLHGRDAAAAGENHQYIGIDIRGHGMTSHSLDHEYSLDAVVNDVIKFIVHKDIYKRKSILVGSGVGAVIAAVTAKWYEMVVTSIRRFSRPLRSSCSTCRIMDTFPKGDCPTHDATGFISGSNAHRNTLLTTLRLTII